MKGLKGEWKNEKSIIASRVFNGTPHSEKIKYFTVSKRYRVWTFGGPVVRNPPANSEDMGLIPWFRKIPHSTGKQATITESHML